jgi:ribonuclease P protein component
MSSATFPAAARLHRPSEFAAALAGKRIGRGALFVITSVDSSSQTKLSLHTVNNVTGILPGDLLTPPISHLRIARLGLIMAKRHAKLASTRNALKRVVREVFRHQRAELPAADYVVRLHRKIENVSLTVLKQIARQDAESLFAKAKIKHQKTNKP